PVEHRDVDRESDALRLAHRLSNDAGDVLCGERLGLGGRGQRHGTGQARAGEPQEPSTHAGLLSECGPNTQDLVCARDIHDESGAAGTKLVHTLAVAFVVLALVVTAPAGAEPQDAGNATPPRRPLPSPPEKPPDIDRGPPVENTEEPTGYTGPQPPPGTFPAEQEADLRDRERVRLPVH